EKNIVQSIDKSIMKDKFENIINVAEFTYQTDLKIFKSKDINLVDKDKNIYSYEQAMIDLNKKEIIGKDIIINFSKDAFGNSANDPRLKGKSATSNENETVIKNGIFTTCKKNDTCPPWTLKSSEIKHDKVKKTISYKDAWLQLYDKPIFYFPKFFHPDPTVKRQSGFLIPSILSSSVNGSSLKIPYYQVVSDDKDFTVTPRLYFNNDIMVQNEFRDVGKNSKHITDFSIKKIDDGSKSHFFSNTLFDLELDSFDNSDLEINLEKISSDTYLKNNKIVSEVNESSNLLTSFFKFDAENDDLSVAVSVEAYEDLSKIKDSDKYQFVYPNFTISKLINTNLELNGELNYQVSGSRKKSNTNIEESILINDFDYESKPFFSKAGFQNKFNIFFKNVNKEGKNSSTYNEDLKSENFTSLIINSSLPLKKSGGNYNSLLTPKASLRFNPDRSKDLSDSDRRITSLNIFSNNRLGINESLEGGQSLTLGGQYDLNKKNNKNILSMSIAQIFKDIDDKKMPTNSTMGNKSSDIIGGLKIIPNEYLKFDYDFSLDSDLKTSNYNLLKSTVSINNFVTSFEFMEELNEIGDESYLLSNVGYGFNDSNKIKYTSRKNRKTNLVEFYNLIYEYKNDCLVAAIEYNKDYYSDRELKPSEELFFTLTIVPFSKANSPNLKD
ncbi:organic solvent tolerance protein, partial [Pelagibacteraceae bacterium]|nr:organic solvent tolerance protein [Pelagibacteraceae bacterium]